MPTSATTIGAGETAAGVIEFTDPVCFPNWDSTGHCREYQLTAAIDGTLEATLIWEGLDRGFYNPDLFLVAPDESWIWANELFRKKQGTARISAGETHRLVVLSYGPFPDRFELTALVYP